MLHTIKIKARYAASLLLLSVVLIGTIGCSSPSDTPDMGSIEFRPLSIDDRPLPAVTDVATGKPMAREASGSLPQMNMDAAPGARVDVTQWVGSRGQAGLIGTGFRGADADYIDIADVYWKLNWIRKQIQAGLLPPNLAEAVEKTKRQLRDVKKDKNSRLAEDAIEYLEEGLKHLKAQRTLRAAGASTTLIPWSTGYEAVHRAIEQGNLGFGGRDRSRDRERYTRRDDEEDSPLQRYRRSQNQNQSPILSAGQSDAIKIVEEYAEKYKAPPEEMMKRVWSKAIEKINDLRDELGLMNRAPNRDAVNSYVPSATDIAPAPGEPTDLFQDAVPIPDIQGADKRPPPAEAATEPENPFASR